MLAHPVGAGTLAGVPLLWRRRGWGMGVLDGWMARGALAGTGVIMRWGFSDHEKSGRLEALEERLEWALRHPRATA